VARREIDRDGGEDDTETEPGEISESTKGKN
jgi:hypothetical protein